MINTGGNAKFRPVYSNSCAQGFFDTIQSQVNLKLIVATCGKLQVKIYLARYLHEQKESSVTAILRMEAE